MEPRNDDRTQEPETIPLGKRTGRERPEPGGQPGEFIDDVNVNRNESPSEPKREE